MSEETKTRRTIVQADVLILPTPPDVVKEEIDSYRDTAIPIEQDVVDEISRGIEDVSKRLDLWSYHLIRPFFARASMITSPFQIENTFRTFMSAMILEALKMIDEMTSKLFLQLEMLETRTIKIDEFISQLKTYEENVDILSLAIIVNARKLSNILTRNMPPTLRSAVTIEQLGRLIIERGKKVVS